MGFAENVLNKIRGTPAFKPASVGTFGNWAIEAGDIISVDNDGVVETMPIFSSDMNWNGSAITTIACTGNQKREIQDKQDRKDYAMSSGLSGYTNRKLNELFDFFGVELDNLQAGMSSYVKRVQKKDENGKPLFDEDGNPIWEEWSASAELFTRIDDVKAVIGAYLVKDSEGNYHSFAQILADVIKLQGDTEILGNLSIVDGKLKSSKGIVSDSGITGSSIYANGTGSQGIVSGRRVSCTEIAVGGKDYKPTEITSTTGTVLVLGTA